jgi:maltose-binding protein MalE
VDALNFYLNALYESKIDSFEIKHDSQAFMNGQTAMYQRELWPIPGYKKNAPDLKFGTSMMPQFKNRGTVYSTESAFVPKSSKNPLLAWDVAKYFNQPKYLKLWFRDSGWVPPRIDIDYSDIFAEMPEYKAAFDFPEGYLLTLYPAIPPIDEINTKFGERLEKAFKDKSLAGNPAAQKKFLAEAAAETNQILKDNGLLGSGSVTGNWIPAPKDLGYKF